MTDFSVGLSEHIAYIGGALAGSIVVRDAIASYNYAKLNQNYCSAAAIGGGTGAIGDPWSPAEAFANAVAGDVVYFRAGTYELYYDLITYTPSYYGDRGILSPSNSGTALSPIVFAAYPGEEPIMNANTDVAISAEHATSMGIAGTDYTWFDGFTFQADVGVSAAGFSMQGNVVGRQTLGNKIRRCTFDGGTVVTASTDNFDALRLELTDGAEVSDNYFLGYRQTDNSINTSAIKMYNNDNFIIEHNEVDDCSGSVYLKADNSYGVIRHNYVHDGYWGITGQLTTSQISINNVIHDNLIAHILSNPIAASFEGTVNDGSGWVIYNNTAYDVAGGFGLLDGNQELYNNLLFVSSGWEFTSYPGVNIAACDHNQWGTDPLIFIINLNDPSQIVYSSLAAWQSSGALSGGGNPGVGSLASDPLFTNASGTYSLKSDYTLGAGSPCLGAGRAGVDMGANIGLVGRRV